MTFSFRQATLEDVPALQAIYREASLGNVGDRAALLAHPEALVWDGSLLERAVVLVAVEGARVVGFVTGLTRGGAWELEDLFVAPADQRRGVASSLVASLETRACAAGASELTVTANTHAMAFYRSVGFVAEGETVTAFGRGVRMRLALDGEAGPRPRT